MAHSKEIDETHETNALDPENGELVSTLRRTDIDVHIMKLPPVEVILYDIYKYLLKSSLEIIQKENCIGCVEDMENLEAHANGCQQPYQV
jgi:hypothetical protein